MKRIGILTAGGDTPALNATIHGAVIRANQLRIEVFGLIKGFNSLFNPRVPHVHLNPLFTEIPELDGTKGGSLIGSSRDFVDPEKKEDLDMVARRLEQLGIEGLICVGGDGTLNGLQPLAERLPTVLAPKTIDNDLGLDPSEPDELVRSVVPGSPDRYSYKSLQSRAVFSLDRMVNYVTPGYATAVFVSASGVERLRTTAESHRRIAIIEVMGRHSGYIALGTAYGRPDLIVVPEHPLDLEHLSERVKEIYDRQKNVVIVCGEGIVDERGQELGAETRTTDPAGNMVLSGAAEALRARLIQLIGDRYFQLYRRGNSAREAIFTRKVGHTQRGGRPILFDRFYAAQLGAKAVDMLNEGQNNSVSILQYKPGTGFEVDGFDANRFRDRWGLIHARRMHPSLYDPSLLQPSSTGIEYLLPIFSGAIGTDDMEHVRNTLFAAGNLTQPYHSVNTDVNKRIRFLPEELFRHRMSRLIASWVRDVDEENFARFFTAHPEVRLANARLQSVDLSQATALLLTGGPDVAAMNLRQPVPDPSVIEDDAGPERDAWEFAALENALARGLPILAVCKGMQLMNVHLGGTLHLDIRGHDLPEQKYGNLQALRLGSNATERFELVNSSHHQSLAGVATGLEVEGWYAGDDTIEQVRLRKYPFALGVQYHPERDLKYAPLFERFIAEAAAFG